MRILFDLVTTQYFVGGAQEYIRRVFQSLLALQPQGGFEIIAAHDSSVGHYAYDDLRPESVRPLVADVVDLRGRRLPDVVSQYAIDTLFIGCAQYWGRLYDVSTLTCRVVTVIHDLCDHELEDSHITSYLRLGSPLRLLKKALRHLLGVDRRMLSRLDGFVALARQNPQACFVTVSDFSRYSIAYHLAIPEERITTLYSPERGYGETQPVADATLRQLIEGGDPYILMLGGNREMKNTAKAVRAFRRFVKRYPQYRLLTVGYLQSECPQHVITGYLSESDLQQAYAHCSAFLFPSLFEGFGYPPLEAMSFAKPVLAANVTSIPEVLGEAPIYFSPFYTSDIYAALCRFASADAQTLSDRSRQAWQRTAERQHRDLDTLLQLIVTP